MITDLYDATVSMNFAMIYNSNLNKYSMTGKFESVKSTINLAGTTFFVKKAFVSFNNDVPPYIYVDMRGSGSQNSVNIKIYGFLTNYKIELIDRNPNNSNFLQADSAAIQDTVNSNNSRAMMLNLMNGALSQKVVNVSERLFGINRVGFEERRNKGENSSYVKVGRMFSDRLEVKYRVGTNRDDSNTIAAEYILLDWFK